MWAAHCNEIVGEICAVPINDKNIDVFSFPTSSWTEGLYVLRFNFSFKRKKEKRDAGEGMTGSSYYNVGENWFHEHSTILNVTINGEKSKM